MQINKERKLEQLERILSGRTFHGSESLRAFLRFVVSRSVEGQEGQLKEYVIATEVFGRGGDFDPRLDSVVRVQAGRLRTKLHDYYKAEGHADEIVIDLPKGHYTPVFALASAAHPHPNGNHLLAESFVSVETTAGPPDELTAVAPVWGELLSLTDPVVVVFSNTIFHGTYDTGMKLFNSLNVMEGNGDTASLSQTVTAAEDHGLPKIDHYTGIGELMGVYFLSDFFARVHHPFRLKRSLLLTWDDAKTENIVVLGSPAENLFLLDLPQQQDFVFRWIKDEQGRHVNAIVNTRPQAGEQEIYLAKHFGPSPSQISEDYAVISFLRGLSEKNRLLILAGINTYGTQGAAEYATRPDYVRDLIAHLNTAAPEEPARLPAFYQVLLKVKVNGGVPVQVSYVTHHALGA